MAAAHSLSLRLHSGVPIVDVLGSWEPALTDALTDMVDALAGAGHYEIVVNVQRAALDGVSALRSLSRVADAIRSHCGHLDVVGTVEQIERLQRLATEHVECMFRLASSEEGALGRIKRMPVMVAGIRCTTRPPHDR